jgi:hypothetical protein
MHDYIDPALAVALIVILVGIAAGQMIAGYLKGGDRG